MPCMYVPSLIVSSHPSSPRPFSPTMVLSVVVFKTLRVVDKGPGSLWGFCWG